MQILNCPFLFGKIKLWEKPVFDLDEIESGAKEFRLELERVLGIKIAKAFIKAPNPRTILGKLKETVRFDYGTFMDSEISPLFDHIEFGFGERGFYYDIHLKPMEIEYSNLKSQMIEIIKKIETFEQTIEESLEAFYFDKTTKLNEMKFSDISNFDMTTQGDFPFSKLAIPIITPLSSIVEKSSDPIVNEIKNRSFLQLHFKILPRSIPSDEPLSEPSLPIDRFFVINQMPKQDSWQFVSRGIPVRTMLQILDNLLETPANQSTDI